MQTAEETTKTKPNKTATEILDDLEAAGIEVVRQ